MTFEEHEERRTMLALEVAQKQEEIAQLTDAFAKQLGLPVRKEKFTFLKNVVDHNYRTVTMEVESVGVTDWGNTLTFHYKGCQLDKNGNRTSREAYARKNILKP